MSQVINEQVLFATLLLTYTIGELQLILLQHTKSGSRHSKYGSNDATETMDGVSHSAAENVFDNSLCIGDFLELKPRETRKDTIGGYMKVLESEHYRIQHIVVILFFIFNFSVSVN